MSEKSIEDILVKDGEIHQPRVRGAIEKWIEHKVEYNDGDEKGCIPVDIDRGLSSAAYGDWFSFLNRRVEESLTDYWGKDEERAYLKDIFEAYWHDNEELQEKFKGIAYWCTDGAALLNVEAAEDQGGIEDLIDEYGKQTLATASYEGRQYLDGRDGSKSDKGEEEHRDQSSFGASRFPELFEVGVVDESGNTKQSKLRGLVIAFTGDIDEIRGEDREFSIDAAKAAFLYWGKDRFGEEWIHFVANNTSNKAISEAVEWVYNNHDDGNTAMHKKYRGNCNIEVGNPTSDDVSVEFLDTEVPGWNEEDDDEETDGSKSKWEKFEEEAEEQYDSNEDDRQDREVSEGSNDPDSSGGNGRSSTSGPRDLEDWGEAEGTTDKVKHDTDNQGCDTSGSTGSDTSRRSSRDGGVDADASGTLGAFAQEHGTTDEVHKPSRTRERQDKISNDRRQSGGDDGEMGAESETKNGNSGSRNSRRSATSGVNTDGVSVECEDGGRPHEIKWPDVDPIDEFERNRIYEGNTFEWAMKLPKNSVDTMVTSPPYYALRDYDIEDAFPISGDFTCDHDWESEFCTKCGSFLGQLGHEPDPATFVEHIVDLMDRYKRVLKPTGSLWLNIGDTYAGKNFDGRVKAKDKSRMMIPERVYRRMVQTGWRLRDYVIWVKKIWMPDDDLKGNGKPFASSSRLADQWEPMVRFTPTGDNYVDVDSNRLKPPSFSGDLGSEGIEGKFREGEDTQRGKTYNELGTNPPDVWLINSDGYDGDHRAVFPEELPKRCVNITTPDKVCSKCGRPYDKEVHVEDDTVLSPGGDYATYEPRCNCQADDQPGVAFDPFLGSGTTAVAAANNGFDWAGVELSEKYAELARDRIPTGRQVGLDQW